MELPAFCFFGEFCVLCLLLVFLGGEKYPSQEAGSRVWKRHGRVELSYGNTTEAENVFDGIPLFGLVRLR